MAAEALLRRAALTLPAAWLLLSTHWQMTLGPAAVVFVVLCTLAPEESPLAIHRHTMSIVYAATTILGPGQSILQYKLARHFMVARGPPGALLLSDLTTAYSHLELMHFVVNWVVLELVAALVWDGLVSGLYEGVCARPMPCLTWLVPFADESAPRGGHARRREGRRWARVARGELAAVLLCRLCCHAVYASAAVWGSVSARRRHAWLPWHDCGAVPWWPAAFTVSCQAVLGAGGAIYGVSVVGGALTSAALLHEYGDGGLGAWCADGLLRHRAAAAAILTPWF